ncbi:MAG: ribose-phosphate diphosphokinase [Planctomycetales bacterium]
MLYEQLAIISGRAHPELAAEIAEYLGLSVANVESWNFPDGEIGIKLNENIRGRDVFIVQPTCPPVNENLMELLVLMDACRRASAERITAVIPYFGYARQDRKDSGRVPITAKLVANLIQSAGADRVLTMDLHAACDPGVFRRSGRSPVCRSDSRVHFKTLELPSDLITIVSSTRGASRSQYAELLGGSPMIVDKRRSNATTTRQANPIGGPIDGRTRCCSMTW